MTAQVLYEAMGGVVSIDRYAELLPAFSDALVKADCDSLNRVAMFCAQIGHESVGLKYMSEIWGPTSDQVSYQGRMGNNSPGDGYRFRGRGPLQVTGKDNYRALSVWAYERGLVPTITFFVDNPDELAGDTYGFLGAVWYWQRMNLNRWADDGDIENASKAINAPAWIGTSNRANGITNRIARWQRCMGMGGRLLLLVEAEDWSEVWYELTGERDDPSR